MVIHIPLELYIRLLLINKEHKEIIDKTYIYKCKIYIFVWDFKMLLQNVSGLRIVRSKVGLDYRESTV